VEVAIGVDPAKGSLAVAAVDPLGRVLDAGGFSNDPRGHQALLGWVRERGPNRVIGIECSLSYGAALSRYLLDAGEDVREVPTTLTARERRRRHAQGKSDLVDAVAVARIVASGEVLPSAHRVEVLTDLRARTRSSTLSRDGNGLVRLSIRWAGTLSSIAYVPRRSRIGHTPLRDPSTTAEMSCPLKWPYC
jgi:transposase